MNQINRGLPPTAEQQKENIKNLASMAENYRKKNDEIAAEQDGKVQVCTLEDLKIIVREAYHIANKALKRVERLEQRLEQQGGKP
jgi:hypothetical protein